MSDYGATRQRAMLLTSLIVALAVLAASLTLIEQRTRAAVVSAAGWVSHTLEVVREFQATHTLIEEAETGQRGFLLTGREMYLSTFVHAREDIAQHLARVRTLTADNVSQQSRLSSLNDLTSRKLAIIDRTIAAARAHHPEEALRIVETNEGRDLMEAIHATVSAGIDDEDRLLAERQAAFGASVRRRSAFAVGLAVTVLVMVLGISLLLLRLGSVRALARICTRSKTVEYQGSWITFEDYLLRRFDVDVRQGISPVEAERFIREHGDPRRI